METPQIRTTIFYLRESSTNASNHFSRCKSCHPFPLNCPRSSKPVGPTILRLCMLRNVYATQERTRQYNTLQSVVVVQNFRIYFILTIGFILLYNSLYKNAGRKKLLEKRYTLSESVETFKFGARGRLTGGPESRAIGDIDDFLIFLN